MSKRPAESSITLPRQCRGEAISICFCDLSKYNDRDCKGCGQRITKGSCIISDQGTCWHTACSLRKRQKTGQSSSRRSPTGVAYILDESSEERGQAQPFAPAEQAHPRACRVLLPALNQVAQDHATAVKEEEAEVLEVGNICSRSDCREGESQSVLILKIIAVSTGPDANALCLGYVPLSYTTIGKTEANKWAVHKKVHHRNARNHLFGVHYARLPEQLEIPVNCLQKVTNPKIDELERGHLVWGKFRADHDPSKWTFFYESTVSPTAKRIPINRPPIGLDIFAGAGGVSLGFENASLNMKYSIEQDPHAAATLKRRFPNMKVYQKEVCALLGEMKCPNNRKALKQGDIDFLHASPPCQGHSRANPRRGEKEEKNNNLTIESIKYVEWFRPKVFTLENVLGLVDRHTEEESGKSSLEYLQEAVARLISLGYQVRVSSANAADYGDPQNRRRVILVAVQNGYRLPCFPYAQYGQERPHTTAAQAIGDLETHSIPSIRKIDGCLKDLYPSAGQNDDPLALEFKMASLKKARKALLDKNSPSPTIACSHQSGIVHYNQKRLLTLWEKARLQSFPDDYEFKGDLISVSRQIGNAVPICLATAIGKMIKDCFNVTSKQLDKHAA